MYMYRIDFFFNFKNVQSVNSLVSGVLIESAPLDNGESIEYHNFLTQLLNIRTQTLSLLTQPLHPFYKTRKVSSYFWFEPNEEQIMHHQPTDSRVDATALNTIYEKTSSWNVTKEFIEQELDTQKASKVDVKFCIQSVQTESKASKTISPHSHTLEDKNEIVANVLWKTLEIRDFLTCSKHIYTPWGQALAVGLSASNTHPEAMLTALELIRFEVLTNKEYSKTYSHPLGDGKLLIGSIIIRLLIYYNLTFRESKEKYHITFSNIVITTNAFEECALVWTFKSRFTCIQ